MRRSILLVSMLRIVGFALAAAPARALDRVFHTLMAEPSPRGLTRPVYDPEHKRIVLFGGDSHDRVHSDTWVYDPGTRTWEQRFPEVAPPPRAGHVLRWLPEAKRIVLAGGYSRRPLAQDIWTYDVAKNEWAVLKVVALKRHRHNRWYSPGTPRASGQGYPIVGDIAPGDVLFALPPRSDSVWACRIDASKTDAKNQAKLAVEPGTFTFHRIDPAAWEKVAKPDADRMKAFFDELPNNQWTSIPFAKRPPLARNIWGTTAYDRDRHRRGQHGLPLQHPGRMLDPRLLARRAAQPRLVHELGRADLPGAPGHALGTRLPGIRVRSVQEDVPA
ncbi:MAG: Kelch repeat-containing protein [Planctomycetota bacterium]